MGKEKERETDRQTDGQRQRERELRNSLVDECWSYFNKSISKSPKRKTVLFSFDYLSNRLLT